MGHITEIEKIVHRGFGLGRLDQKIVFISNVLAHEEVEIKLIRERKDYSFAVPERIRRSSPDRIDPPCPYYPVCGGCHFLHTSYSHQLEIKEQILSEFLLPLQPLTVQPFVPSPAVFHYKTSVRFIRQNGRLGFNQRHSHHFVPIDSCLLLDANIMPFLKRIKMNPEYSYCIAKTDNQNNHSCNLYHEKKGHLQYRINDLVLLHDFRTFFQSNSSMIGKWLEVIRDEASRFNLKRVLELYSGVGVISLYLSRCLDIKKITGIEIDNTAVNFAKMNREKNKLFQVHFQAGPVEKVLNNYEKISTAICNPPRGGIGPGILSRLIKTQPEAIIISSCEVSNFIRDALFLKEKGYQCINVIPLDMFPHTFHFEIIGSFTR
ncbi:MAG: methyltransferase [bacterium]|nr:methyltransferase [bacterium]